MDIAEEDYAQDLENDISRTTAIPIILCLICRHTHLILCLAKSFFPSQKATFGTTTLHGKSRLNQI